MPPSNRSFSKPCRDKRETGRTTQIGARYGCFLPDLTGLARDLSAADLPLHYIRSERRADNLPGASPGLQKPSATNFRPSVA